MTNPLKKIGRNAFSYGQKLNPTRDWLVILLVTILFIFLSVLYNLWLFAHMSTIENNGGKNSLGTSTEPSLATVNEVFAARAQERENYMRVYRFVDPSR